MRAIELLLTTSMANQFMNALAEHYIAAQIPTRASKAAHCCTTYFQVVIRLS